MSNKQFSERLNRELDAIGVPCMYKERVKAVAKIFKLPSFTAQELLNGSLFDIKLVDIVAAELEVNPHWLLGKSPVKTKVH
ncbi:hypothetical protein Lqui_0920 [Legionella quinlivanii]|uniref:Transcriptional regulator n=1 Tax=Legionella quinlivanii TaxID=45073 RepID=A0A0W0Y4Y8_9GAMM|nr:MULTISPECIES: hypothetical protein [Legionella]KTD52076.1 hypothetical protein Lqui_0920 [Legionella quinlivanii]MCE3046223.1 hypothetical protein [Legionella sp. 16cNR16C]MCW8452340.1 hypothetical protein [Legionella quinlivanii]RAP37342.1 hypothetical protein B1207_03980 [Legionella quinlivanii]SEF89433.1 hypothetical protein SAMN02746093_01383 [Legionella quinlivanii DSM 21216]